MQKLKKTYVVMISREFPKTHSRAGEPTYFKEKIKKALGLLDDDFTVPKIHTLRGNYDLWRKRFEEIEAGRACLSVREWIGKPYRSKQREIVRLIKEDGIGLQKINFVKRTGTPISELETFTFCAIDNVINHSISYIDIAENDGLSHNDFKEWFNTYDLSKPMAIIHFTNFKY